MAGNQGVKTDLVCLGNRTGWNTEDILAVVCLRVYVCGYGGKAVLQVAKKNKGIRKRVDDVFWGNKKTKKRLKLTHGLHLLLPTLSLPSIIPTATSI